MTADIEVSQAFQIDLRQLSTMRWKDLWVGVKKRVVAVGSDSGQRGEMLSIREGHVN